MYFTDMNILRIVQVYSTPACDQSNSSIFIYRLTEEQDSLEQEDPLGPPQDTVHNVVLHTKKFLDIVESNPNVDANQ